MQMYIKCTPQNPSPTLPKEPRSIIARIDGLEVFCLKTKLLSGCDSLTWNNAKCIILIGTEIKKLAQSWKRDAAKLKGLSSKEYDSQLQ